MRDPLVEGGGLVGGQIDRDPVGLASRFWPPPVAQAISRPLVVQAARRPVDLDRVAAGVVGEADFGRGQGAVRVAEGDHGVIFDGPPGDVAVGRAHRRRHAQEMANQVDRMAPEVDQGAAGRLDRIVEVGGKPAIRVGIGAQGAVVGDAHAEVGHCTHVTSLDRLPDRRRVPSRQAGKTGHERHARGLRRRDDLARLRHGRGDHLLGEDGLSGL